MNGHTEHTLQTTGLYAATFLMGRGLSRDAAVAVTCCLWYESKLNPGSQGTQATERGGKLNRGGAYGIASWNGTRQDDLDAFSIKKGIPVDALDTQLWFVLNEAANKYPKTWAAINGGGRYEEIIPVFVEDYEHPADPAKEIAAALGYAKELYPLVPDVAAPVAAVKPPDVPEVAKPQEPPLAATVGPATGTPWAPDQEIAAMEKAFELLSSLPKDAQHRVLVYLYARLNA